VIEPSRHPRRNGEEQCSIVAAPSSNNTRSTQHSINTESKSLLITARRPTPRRKPFPNTICKRDVKGRKAWIFEYDPAGYPGAMYILRCPSTSCESPVFRCHPMRHKRAEKHFRNCKVRFRDEEDIVLRFACQGMFTILRAYSPLCYIAFRWFIFCGLINPPSLTQRGLIVILKKSEPQPCLDRRWARNWNASLISSNERELAEENFKM
jgi:hypothetical protein